MSYLSCLLCRVGRRRRPASTRSERNESSSERDRKHGSSHILNPVPIISSNVAAPNSPQSPTSARVDSPSTPSLPSTDTDLHSKPSPASPEASSDGVVKLVLKMQRKVIRYVQGLDLQSDECSSHARSRIYSDVIRLVQSSTRNPEECESISGAANTPRVETDHATDKAVAQSLQEALIKPLSATSRANTELVSICEYGPAISSTIRKTGKDYAFGNVDENQTAQARRIEFPALKRDGTPLLEELRCKDVER